MGDPELRNDEKVLVRTQGVYVKSIPFEGILTNKRIILIDRAKNLLPPKEIPLITVKEVDPGENAIRDQILTLSVMAKTGETRQMILTFSRQTGGNRKKERDDWLKIIRDNTSSSFEQVIRKVIPGFDQVPRKAGAPEPRSMGASAPAPAPVPAGERPRQNIDTGGMQPVRMTVDPGIAAPVPPAMAEKSSTTAPPGATLFCTSCGKKVPANSSFCNRCGSQIVPYAEPSAAEPMTPPSESAPAISQIEQDIQSIDPLIEPSGIKIPGDPLRMTFPSIPLNQSMSFDEEPVGEPAPVQEPAVPSPAAGKPASKGFMPRLFAPKKGSEGQPVPAPANPWDQPAPPKPPRGPGSGKKVIKTVGVIAIVLIILAAVVLFVYPMLTGGGGSLIPGGTGNPVTTAPTPKLPVTMFVPSETTHVIPASGVFVHVNYLGGWTGTYGMPPDMLSITNSGDRVMEVELANGTVNASFMKQDGSAHLLLVEIYKDNTVLTKGTTTIGHGTVELSVNVTTGVALAPITSGGGAVTTAPSTTAVNTTATAIPVVSVNTTTTTAVPASTVTTAVATTTTAAL